MEKYDYREAVKSDLMDMFWDRNHHGEWDDYLNDHAALKNEIYLEAVGDTYVTGNDCYGYNPECAKEEDKAQWLADNTELLEEAKAFYGYDDETEEAYKEDPSHWDCTIRYYVLPQVMDEFMEELKEKQYI